MVGRLAGREHRILAHTAGAEIMAVTIMPTRTQPRGIVERERNNLAKKLRERINNVIRGNRMEVTAKCKLDFGYIGIGSTVQWKTERM